MRRTTCVALLEVLWAGPMTVAAAALLAAAGAAANAGASDPMRPVAGPAPFVSDLASDLAPGAPALVQVAQALAVERAAARSRIDDRLVRSQLLIAAAMARGAAPGELAALSTPLTRVRGDGRIQVAIRLAAPDAGLLDALIRAGVAVERTDLPFGSTAQAWLLPSEIDMVAALPVVARVTLPDYGRTRAGAVTTQGDAAHRSEVVRAAPMCIDGSCVKVGVISDGVSSADDAASTGDLPDNGQGFELIDVDPDQPGSGDEGTAMLEIIHDLAPAAAVAFSGPETSVDMVNSIDFLSDAGCHVICDDLGFFGEPFFADGPLAQAAQAAIDAGIVYVSAAGNEAEVHYQGDFDRLGVGGTWFHDFGGSDVAINMGLPAGATIDAFLQWDEAFGMAGTDFNLFLFNQAGDMILASSTDLQDGDDDPFEALSYTNEGMHTITVKLSVVDVTGNAPNHVLEIFALGDDPGFVWDEHVVAADSVFGHPAVVDVLSTAAVAAGATPCGLESYSSRGPSTILVGVFDPEERPTPAVAATTCVSVTGAGCFGCDDPCPPQNNCIFCGTSAAAPHIAGIAAQLLEAKPGATPAEIRAALVASVTDCGPLGPDTGFGAGFVDVPEAVETLAPGATTCAADLNGDGVVDGADLGRLLRDWGPVECDPDAASLGADLTCDSMVGADDLGELLALWGACG